MPNGGDYISRLGIGVGGAPQVPPDAPLQRTVAREADQLNYITAQAASIFARQDAELRSKEQAIEAQVQGDAAAVAATLKLQEAWTTLRQDPNIELERLVPTIAAQEQEIRQGALKDVLKVGPLAAARFLSEYSPKMVAVLSDAQSERFGRWRHKQSASLDLTIKGIIMDVEQGGNRHTGLEKATEQIARLAPGFLTAEQANAKIAATTLSIQTAYYNNQISQIGRSTYIMNVVRGFEKPPIDQEERAGWEQAYKDALALENQAYEVSAHAATKKDREFKDTSEELAKGAMMEIREGTYGRNKLRGDIPRMRLEDAKFIESTLENIDKAGGGPGNPTQAAQLKARMNIDAQEGRLGSWSGSRIGMEAKQAGLNSEQVWTLSHELNSLQAAERAGDQDDYDHYKKTDMFKVIEAELKTRYGLLGDPSLFNPAIVIAYGKANTLFHSKVRRAYYTHLQDPKAPALTPELIAGYANEAYTLNLPPELLRQIQKIGK